MAFQSPANFPILQELWDTFHVYIRHHEKGHPPRVRGADKAALIQAVRVRMPQYLWEFTDGRREPDGSRVIRHSLAARLIPSLDPERDSDAIERFKFLLPEAPAIHAWKILDWSILILPKPLFSPLIPSIHPVIPDRQFLFTNIYETRTHEGAILEIMTQIELLDAARARAMAQEIVFYNSLNTIELDYPLSTEIQEMVNRARSIYYRLSNPGQSDFNLTTTQAHTISRESLFMRALDISRDAQIRSPPIVQHFKALGNTTLEPFAPTISQRL